MEDMAGEHPKLSPKSEPTNQKKKGFSVGPDNLPDGVHRRKVLKIKQNLIRKAQIKKSYNKLKSREPELYAPSNGHGTGPDEVALAPPPASLELHPDRQAMLDHPGPPPHPNSSQSTDPQRRQRQPRPPRPVPFQKEAAYARQRKEEQQARQEAYEVANREREMKRDERERFRKAMSKARSGGRDGGQRKLGRESKVLLEKVQRMVNG